MAVTITEAGESLIARLQAEGNPLIIDRFALANVAGQDPSKEIDRKTGLPATVVHTAVIPEEYRAFVNPNQVVYSCLLGSDIGDFTFNWQGLYCNEHKTLVAAATFPALRIYSPLGNSI